MWNKDKIIKLIDFYSKKSFLWNTKHPDYKNKSLKKAAYLEIAQDLSIEHRDIPIKWIYLKNTYLKEIKKTRESKGEYKSKWHIFDKLCFLRLEEEVSEETPLSIEIYCRSCMKETNKLIDVFTTSIGQGSLLSEVFYLITGISIIENDELPTKICENCKESLEQFLSFKDRADLVQENLRGMLEVIKNPTSIKLEEHFDDDYVDDSQEEQQDEPVKKIRKKVKREKKEVTLHQCHLCEKSFKDKSYLAKHISFHENLRSFLCDLCGKGFNSEAIMKTHRLIHTGEKPFTCKFCSRQFRQASVLSIHIAAKHKEKKSKCPDCGKCFTQRFDMERHRRVHTGERPFACSECDKTYTKKFALDEHFKVFHRGFKYICEICSKELSCASHLSRHLKLHTNERPFKCTLCTQDFSRSDYLKKHMSKEHGTTNENDFKMEQVFDSSILTTNNI